MRAALYIRVSTDKQTTENQRRELAEIAKRRGWEVAEVYEDAAITGAKGRADRPGLDSLLKDAQRRKFDVVMVKAMDRLGRSMSDLLHSMEHLKACGVDLFVDKQAIDTTTPMGKLLFHVTGAFAEFERDMIRQRVKAGLDRVKVDGTKSGKPIGRPKVKQEVQRAILNARAAGKSFRQTAKDCGVALSTVQKVVKEAA